MADKRETPFCDFCRVSEIQGSTKQNLGTRVLGGRVLVMNRETNRST